MPTFHHFSLISCLSNALDRPSNHAVRNSSITTKHLYLILTFQSHHEIFIRRSWYSVLPSLDATISCHIKKAVVGVTQLITAFMFIGSRGHSGTTGIHPFHNVFHIQRPTLQTERSLVQLWDVLFLLWWPICTWNT